MKEIIKESCKGINLRYICVLNHVKVQNKKLNCSINYERSSLPSLFSEIEDSTSLLNIGSLDNNWNHCTFLLFLILNDPVGLGDIS